jgi:hypothetical protein
MNKKDAMDLMFHLLDLAKEGDAEALEAENLPPAVQMLLGKITAMNAEIIELGAIVERREREVAELDDLMLQQLMQLS